MQEQGYKNHLRLDPAHHMVAVPLALITFIGAVVHLVVHFSWLSVLFVIAALALALVIGNLRRYATKLQDRIVRMEENFRHFTLTGKALDPKLTLDQIIALRFASDDEFPGLCERAVREAMSKDQIKRAVQSWRADLVRV